MERKSNFFVCEKCGNFVKLLTASGKELSCCENRMENVVPLTEGVLAKKHLPKVSAQKNRVRIEVGEVMHPSEQNHAIAWIHLITRLGSQYKHLLPGDEPVATFVLGDGDIPIAAYAYCSTHGLWKTQINKSDTDKI